MEDRETARTRKYGESKTTRIMMATVPHVTSCLGLRKFQADEFSLTRVYKRKCKSKNHVQETAKSYKGRARKETDIKIKRYIQTVHTKI